MEHQKYREVVLEIYHKITQSKINKLSIKNNTLAEASDNLIIHRCIELIMLDKINRRIKPLCKQLKLIYGIKIKFNKLKYSYII